MEKVALTYRYITGKIDQNLAERVARNLIQLLEDNFNWLNFFDSLKTQNTSVDNRMKKVFQYCTKHYPEKVSATSLARELHINESYFSQFFKKSPYGGFGKMLGYIRCFYSQIPLLSSEKTVTEIANKCGFSDDKYFYKHFSYCWNQTPSQFRKWYRDYAAKEECMTILSSEEILPTFEKYMAEFFAEVIL